MPYSDSRNNMAVCTFKRQGIFTNITPAEKVFLISNIDLYSIIDADRKKAMNEAANRYPRETLWNGTGDAFRHCYFSALLTRDIGGAKALELTTLHEDYCGNPDDERKMDLHNNSIGIGIARNLAKTFADDALAELCAEAEKGGKLKTLK